MSKEMLINVSEGEECRIALLEDGQLEELYMERTSSTSHVGNIYKGRVTNVEPSIQAAFVDFGLGRNGFLHISDLMPTYFGRKGEEIHETVGRKMARRDRPPIQRCLRRGDEIVVQIIKEGIGTKGPTLSTYLSIPGRILVMMPGMGKMGVSKKIEDEEERRRLRQILDSLKPPKDVGFIIRTAGIGKAKTEIQRDLTYLSRLWATIEKKRAGGAGPMELYTEGDLVTRTVRDVFSTDIERIVVDNKDVARRIKEVIKITNPRTRNKVELFEEPVPLFHKYGIEREIELMYSRHVPLPSGGSLVIDSTEAIVAIDVNSGKFRDHSDAETTAFKTDMEAADEIARQLKLRDLGGVIICDFIDLRYERHRRDLEQRLHDNLKNDRAKTKVLRMSQFGIIEMTRQRMRPSFKRSVYFDCPHCKGAGLVKTPESMSLDVMRRLAIAMNDERVQRMEMAVCPDVSFYLQNRKRAQLSRLETDAGKRLVIRSDPALGLDEMRLELFDSRDGMVIIEELGAVLASQPHTTQLGVRPAAQRGGRKQQPRRDDRRQQGQGQNRSQSAPQRRPEPEAEEFNLDEADEIRDEHHEEGYEEHESREEHPVDRASQPVRNDRDQQPAGSRQGEPAGQGNGEGEGENGPRRRRRRRGRRGRGRRNGGQGQPQGDEHFVGPAPDAMNDDRSDTDVEITDEIEHEVERDIDRDVEESTDTELFPVEARRIEEDHAEIVGAESEIEVVESEAVETKAAPRKRAPARRAPRAAKPAQSRAKPAPITKEAIESSADDDAPADAESEEAAPKRRRRRGGRRGGKSAEKNAASASSADEAVAPDDKTPADAPKVTAPARKLPSAAQSNASTRSHRVVADEKPVIRTGSTDRHLVSDEPVSPQPVSRPRSYTDLDEIPDDFD